MESPDPDVLRGVMWKLHPDDIYNLSLCNRNFYKAFRKPEVQKLVCFPLVPPKMLNWDQRMALKSMEESAFPVRILLGDVGSGKTITSLAFALKGAYEKVIVVTPPALIPMWEKTCKDYFGIQPYVAHNSNPKYKRKMLEQNEAPSQKVIIFSTIIFENLQNRMGWIESISKILIIDEAHRRVDFSTVIFNDVIALSATVERKKVLRGGIRSLLKNAMKEIMDDDFLYGEALEMISHKLETEAINEEVPQEIHVFHKEPVSQEVKETVLGQVFLGQPCISDIRKVGKLLSHPVLLQKGNFAYKYKRGRKTFSVVLGGLGPTEVLPELPLPIWDVLEKSPKYKKVLQIYREIEAKGEKSILIDRDLEGLPFLAYWLYRKGVPFYLYTIDYDVSSRQKQIDKFKAHEGSCLLLSSVGMLGEGHNIPEAVHVIIFAPLFHDDKYTQVIGRCKRYPQKKQVTVHHLFCSRFDEECYRLAYEKINHHDIDWVDSFTE